MTYMKGSVDRIEDNNIAIIVLDNGKVISIDDNLGLKEGDRIIYSNTKIKKINDENKKKKMIELQNKIFGRR